MNRMIRKRIPTVRYAPSTINYTLTAVHEFYEFHRGRWGPILNPVPGVTRRYEHHDPSDPGTPGIKPGDLRIT